MNKADILRSIIAALQEDLATLEAAVKDAHESATHAESVAENKYDTRGLEAAYLAHGQAKRAAEIKASLLAYESINPLTLTAHSQVKRHSLVHIEDQHGQQRWLWLGDNAGGLSFNFNSDLITIVTTQSPLGAALLGKEQGDMLTLNITDKRMEYEVIKVY